MAANTLSFTQIGTILNNIVEQATGQKQMAVTDTASFITVAQTGLLTGTENLMNAISQVLSRTIISNRPYTRKFKGLEADSIMYGNHVRKINYVDGKWEDNKYLPIEDGTAVDQQKPTKNKVIQTNFYGSTDCEIPWTIFRNQILTAFRGPEELAGFITGLLQNISDRTEQKHESMSRAALANLIGGIITIANTPQIVHLLTEYNAESGQQLTATSVYAPDNFAPFMRWVYARIGIVSDYLTERTTIYHQNLTAGDIARHTPKDMQRLFIYSPALRKSEANALSTTYHDKYLGIDITETVSYWQSIKTPDSINVIPSYLDKDGTIKKPMKSEAAQPLNQSNIFALLADQEAAGLTIINDRMTSAPYNGAGEYQNFWRKFTDRYWNDFTENAVVFLLD